MDDDVLLVAWLDLPGIALANPELSTIAAAVGGIDPGADLRVATVGYVDGERRPISRYGWESDGTLRIAVPRTSDPVLYLLIER